MIKLKKEEEQIMKFRIEVGDINQNESSASSSLNVENGINVAKWKKNLILSEYEVTGIDLIGTKISDSTNKKENPKVQKDSTFEVKITCRVRSIVDSDAELGIFTNFGKSIGSLPSQLSDYNNYRQVAESLYNSKDASGKLQAIVALKNPSDNSYQEVSIKQSSENCINIKKWYLLYKVDEQKKAEDSKNKKEGKSSSVSSSSETSLDDKVYRDVKIEAVLSDVQSFYYEFKNMYVDYYEEHLSTEEGASTYAFILKEKYITDKSENKLDLVESTNFSDKFQKGFKVISDSLKDVFGKF
jgi:hypothetical protein